MSVSGLLDEQLDSIKGTRANLGPQALKIIAEIQETIIDYNKANLLQGLNAKGQRLTPKYSRVRYARAKNQSNPLPGLGTPDLKLTEKFQSDFFLTARKGLFTIYSSDDKTPKLEGKYGQDIFGVTVDQEGIINEQIFEGLLEWILTKI